MYCWIDFGFSVYKWSYIRGDLNSALTERGKKGSARPRWGHFISHDMKYSSHHCIIVSARWRNVRTYSWKCLDFHKNGPYLTPFAAAHFGSSNVNLPSLRVITRGARERGKCRVLHMYYTPLPRSTAPPWEKSARPALRISARLADFATLARLWDR